MALKPGTVRASSHINEHTCLPTTGLCKFCMVSSLALVPQFSGNASSHFSDSLFYLSSELCSERLQRPIAFDSVLNLQYVKQTSHKTGMAHLCTKPSLHMYIEGLINEGGDWYNAKVVMSAGMVPLNLSPCDLSRGSSLW